MYKISVIILTLNSFNLPAQVTGTGRFLADSTKEFKNQGEQEDYWAMQLFKNKYSRQIFNRYPGAIVVNGDSVKYSDKYFLIGVEDQYKLIFTSGIIYPTIISGQDERDFRLAISNVEELRFLESQPTEKRFRFWLGRNILTNPTVCFFELTNQTATDKTDLETFIKGASLTFYAEGWLII